MVAMLPFEDPDAIGPTFPACLGDDLLEETDHRMFGHLTRRGERQRVNERWRVVIELQQRQIGMHTPSSRESRPARG
ncbi:MAG: hypothetical protein ACRDRF_18830, partial [Pseudonocardiaceae bacterium]